MTYAIWLVPVTLVLLAPVLIERPSWVIIFAILLIIYGGIASYRLGTRWERRWDDLIREKSAQVDP
jgi:hypothetical protein